MAVVAQKIHDNTRDRVQNGTFSEVSRLAGQYETLVKDGILVQAESLPEPDRQELLNSVAEQFSRAASVANNLATQNPHVFKPLNDMAFTANNARERLLKLARI